MYASNGKIMKRVKARNTVVTKPLHLSTLIRK